MAELSDDGRQTIFFALNGMPEGDDVLVKFAIFIAIEGNMVIVGRLDKCNRLE